jgi:hypothetical protein
MGDRGSVTSTGMEFFSSPPCSDRLWGSPSFLSNGYRGALSLGVMLPGNEADHSTTSGDEVKNALNYTSTRQYAFMAWCLIKQ